MPNVNTNKLMHNTLISRLHLPRTPNEKKSPWSTIYLSDYVKIWSIFYCPFLSSGNPTVCAWRDMSDCDCVWMNALLTVSLSLWYQSHFALEWTGGVGTAVAENALRCRIVRTRTSHTAHSTSSQNGQNHACSILSFFLGKMFVFLFIISWLAKLLCRNTMPNMVCGFLSVFFFCYICTKNTTNKKGSQYYIIHQIHRCQYRFIRKQNDMLA